MVESRSPLPAFDAYSPGEIAQRVEGAGVRKAGMPLVPLMVLSVLAGAFIAFGAMAYTVAITGSPLGFGPTRIFGGAVFSLGLVLVIVGGAELFTGNALIVMAWADGRIRLRAVLRNWTVAFIGNLLGALATAMMMHLADGLTVGGGAMMETAAAIARAKVGLAPEVAFFRGVLCNTLVCLAVWLSFAAHDVASKAVAILFPITAFVALGFEHAIANMYLIPIAILSGADGVGWIGFVANLVPVTAGNVVGGGVFVAGVYWMIYRRPVSASRS